MRQSDLVVVPLINRPRCRAYTAHSRCSNRKQPGELSPMRDFQEAWGSLPIKARGVIRFFGWLERSASPR
jgi:hypothetical protein